MIYFFRIFYPKTWWTIQKWENCYNLFFFKSSDFGFRSKKGFLAVFGWYFTHWIRIQEAKILRIRILSTEFNVYSFSAPVVKWLQYTYLTQKKVDLQWCRTHVGRYSFDLQYCYTIYLTRKLCTPLITHLIRNAHCLSTQILLRFSQIWLVFDGNLCGQHSFVKILISNYFLLHGP